MPIRGSGIQVESASSFVIRWPTGTMVGDLAVISVSSGYSPSNPAGWHILYGPAGSAGLFELMSWKSLTSADIAAGSVTVFVTGGYYYGQASIVTFEGYSPLREAEGYVTAAGQSSASVTSSGAVASGDIAIYFGSARADGLSPAVTVNRGSVLQSAGDASFAACIYAENAAGGAITAGFSFSQPSSGGGGVAIVSPPPALTAQTITFPAIAAHLDTDPPFLLAATATSGLAVSYSVTSGPASVAGNTVTLSGAGTVTIQATQAGNASWAAATPVNQTFVVSAPAGNVFPTIYGGQVTMYPAKRTRSMESKVLRFLDDSEQRFVSRVALFAFTLNYTDLKLADMLALRTFFQDVKGSFDSSWQLTFDGVLYTNCWFSSDDFAVQETKPLLFDLTLQITQTL